jgi:hypothetical protein
MTLRNAPYPCPSDGNYLRLAEKHRKVRSLDGGISYATTQPGHFIR